MKIAEGLITKADLEEKIYNFYNRARNNLLVQEGEVAQEDPEKLIKSLEEANKNLVELTAKIHKANSQSQLVDEDGSPLEITIQEALAKKEGLVSLASKLRDLAESATPQNRYSKSEIKFIATVDSKILQTKADKLSKEARELDIAIQRTNWLVDL